MVLQINFQMTVVMVSKADVDNLTLCNIFLVAE